MLLWGRQGLLLGVKDGCAEAAVMSSVSVARRECRRWSRRLAASILLMLDRVTWGSHNGGVSRAGRREATAAADGAARYDGGSRRGQQ